jgi:hypothetical protein
MPKILATPETIVVERARTINRKDILSFAVEIPLDTTDFLLRRTYLGRQMDPVTGLPADGGVFEAPPLTGLDAQTALTDAGRRVIQSALALYQLAPSATIADLAAAITKAPETCGAAYYAGTRDALYDTI